MTKAMIVLLVSAGLMSSGAAVAATSGAPRDTRSQGPSPAVDALTACRAIADNAARLACYDGASARFTEAVNKGEVVVMDRQEIRQTRRSLFGFTLPRIALFKGENKADIEQEEIETTIASATDLGYDKYRIRIEDGAIWETTEAAPTIGAPRPGQKVLIKRGALGNYFLRINGQRGIRGRRVG